MGSASLFFELSPDKALLGDTNKQLVETFLAIRKNANSVHRALKELPIGKEQYYVVRASNVSQLNLYERAARFIYLNRFCFNGLYRTNLSGQFNVPYGSSKSGSLPTLEMLKRVSITLKCCTISCADFDETIKQVESGDFVYLDPPFFVSSRRVFNEYGPNSFTSLDLSRLSLALDKIHRRGARFLVSYALCKEALTSFEKWELRRVITQRNISGFARHRRRAVELLVSNFVPS